MKVIIDRFEEDIAVVELDGEMLHAPKALFRDAKEGDTIELTVLPRRSAEEAAETDAGFEDTADEVFRKNEDTQPADDGDDPAALFRKLRKKKKRRK